MKRLKTKTQVVLQDIIKQMNMPHLKLHRMAGSKIQINYCSQLILQLLHITGYSASPDTRKFCVIQFACFSGYITCCDS